MTKIKNKKLGKTFIWSSALAVPSAIGLGVTLFLIHSNEAVNSSTVYGNFLEGENLFKLYSPYISASENQKNQIIQAYNDAKNIWKSKDTKLKEKLIALDKAQASAFDFYINNLDKVKTIEKEPSIFWNKILSNQEGRIRELDLKDQLTQLKKDQSTKFFDVLYSSTNEQKQEYLRNISSEITKLVASQNEILNPFINLLEGTATKLDTLPFEGLKKDVSSSLTPLYSRIISSNIRLNEVEIASQDTNKEVSKLEEILNSSQSEINEIEQYLKLIKPYENNAGYTQVEKDNVKKFLNSTQINLNIALNKGDINQIRNSVVTFYEQISDTQKTVAEIKQVVSGLNVYVDKFDSKLRFNKELISQLIAQVLLINDKKALISAKSNLFSEFYALKFSNQIINEIQQNAAQALKNNIITPTKEILLSSQMDAIINKNLRAKELANELFKFYNVENNELENLAYLNDELKLIQAQLLDINGLKFTSDDIKNQLKELNNQVIQTYSNSVSAAYLNAVKNKLNESFREILKTNLKQLITLMDQEIALVTNLNDPINSIVVDEAEKLNASSKVMIEDFNPIPSTQIINQIKTYDIKLQNLINANKQTKAENVSEFTDNYLNVVFSNNDNAHVFTDKEQKRINLYNQYKHDLDQLREMINSGNGDEKVALEIEKLSKKLQNLIDTGNDFRALSLLDQQAQATINTKQDGPTSLILKPYINSVENARLELNSLFANPDAKSDQILAAHKKLQKALKELNEADARVLIQQKIAQLKSEIDINYQNDFSSPGAQALLNQYNDLLAQARDISNDQKSDILLIRANSLIEITPYLYDLELNKKRLMKIIGEKNSAKYTGSKTNTSIKRGNEEIKNANDLVARLNDPNNIPNLEAFKNQKNELFNRGDEILLAYEQDKIEILNQEIQNTKNSQSGSANLAYANALEKVNNYAIVQKSQINYQKAQEAAQKMEFLKNLADLSGDLLNSYNLYKDNSKTTPLADYISNLLLNNELNTADENEQIVTKIENLTKAKNIIQAKKDFLDVFEKLKVILEENKNWKIYAPLKSEINLIFQQSNSIIFDNDLTVEQIQAQKDLFENKINFYKTKKQDLLNSFNQAIDKVNQKEISLDADVTAIKNSNTTYNFDTYYAQVKALYANDKTEAQKVNVDTDDINAYLNKLEVGYNKDLALNKLNDLQAIINSASFGNTNLHNKNKTAWNSFDTSVKNSLSLNNLALDDVKAIINKINRSLDLLGLQKRIADYVVSPSRQSQTLSIEVLKDALYTSLPLNSDNFDEINDKYNKLNEVYLKEVDAQEIRENIIATLENDNLANGPFGIVKNLTDALGSTYDNDVTTKLDTFVANTKVVANTATAKADLVDLLTKVNVIKDEVPSIAQLAKDVASAKNVDLAVTNKNSNIINQFSQSLNTLISEAKNSYFKATQSGSANNIAFYTNLSNQIAFTAAKISATDDLATKLKEIQTIVNSSEFNLRTLNGQVSLDKLSEINAYLDSFETTAISNNNTDQAAVDQINVLTQKATAFKNIISTDLDVLKYATTLANTNSTTDASDLNSLISIVWDSIPRANAYNNSSLGVKVGNTYNVNDLFNLDSQNGITLDQYTQLSDKIIQEISDLKALISTKNTYRNLTHTKIEALKNQNFTPIIQNDLKNTLLTFLETLDHSNNTANTFTITPDESGNLNTIRNKVTIIENKLNALKDLATQAYELNNLNSTIVSNDPLVTAAKANIDQLINKAKEYFNDTDKMSLTGSESIENVTLNLQGQKFRLTLLSAYDEVKAEVDSDAVLPTQAKNVLLSKLNEFKTAYNAQNANLEQLYDTYFKNAADVTDVNARNSLIKYILENAVSLQREFNKALSYVALKNTNLDNNAVETSFNQLEALINNAQSGVQVTLNNTQNNEATKIQLRNTIENNINQLISAKKDQLTEQKDTDNEVKNFFDTVNNTLAPGTAPSYVDNFIQKGINDLESAINTKDTLSYSDVNVYLASAKAVASLQIFDLYNRAINAVDNIKTTVADYYNDFALSKTIVRSGSLVDDTIYGPISQLKDSIDHALNDNDFNNIENYANKINALLAIINGNYQTTINNFVTAIKDKFAQKFAPTPQQGQVGQAGFYVKLINKLDPLKQNINGQTYNLYRYNQAEELENQYDAFKNEFENVNQIYNSIISKNDSGSLANFATLVDHLNKEFLKLENGIKDAISKALSKNPLEEVFADLFETIRYSDTSNDTNAIKVKFDTFKQSIQTLSNSVNATNSFNFADLNQTSSLDQTLFDLINKLTEYKDWVKQAENKNLLLTQLDDNPNKANPLPPIEANLDRDFDKKYKVISTNKEYTRKKFVQNFDAIVAANPNANTSELVQIDNNDAFLAMFDQFAFTKKDLKDTGDLKSIYSPIKLKVYIKKYNQNGWFDLVAPTADEVDRQSLRAKVVYSYESSNVDIGGLKAEKDVVITFKTLDKIEVASGTSSIFIKDATDVGTNAKYEVIDVDEAGWNIPQVANTQDPNYQSVKEQVIAKAYNKMKASIFNLTNNSTALSTNVINPDQNYLNALNTSNDPNLQNVRYVTSSQNNRLSAYLDQNNRNSTTKYGFDFDNQASIPITYNVTLTTKKQDEVLNIIPVDSEKGFAFLQMQAGFITGIAPYGKDTAEIGRPQKYDYTLTKAGSGFQNIYNNTTDWWTVTNDKIPPGVNFNLYSFNFDYDPVARKVYVYNSWTENILFVINNSSLNNSLNSNRNNATFKQSDRDFLTNLKNKFGNNPQNYRPLPSELVKAFSLFASLPNAIFNNSDNSHWLPWSSSSSFGGGPVFPLSGGQSTVFRTSRTTPNTATLRNVPASDFPRNFGNDLIKASARQALYSASINKFWFKIR
ncbi:hypothetical protein NPA08_02530 [Mycoplasmopsis citelli]|uniref:hypothetical protein n=1 Tax=Mycoplasmopsis citelli TaxID=171281 RepID=UPI00211450A0|nr:hypothetical protein [Mycoplasmopsis citelli]UUD35821.1 hypothetical protein NPA08_02530 [Mycoplasmopsis citelli]